MKSQRKLANRGCSRDPVVKVGDRPKQAPSGTTLCRCGAVISKNKARCKACEIDANGLEEFK